MALSKPLLVPVGAAIALTGQAVALNGAFQGHPWQIDSHMLYFAFLASLSVLMPSLIYPAGGVWDNIGRTSFHAAIVVLETAALVGTVLQLKGLEVAMSLKAGELAERFGNLRYCAHACANSAKTSRDGQAGGAISSRAG